MGKQAEINIDSALCTGCQRCSAVCPTAAIEGRAGVSQKIDQEKCVRCGQCVQICSAYASSFEHSTDAIAEMKKMRGLPADYHGPVFAAHYTGVYTKVKQTLAQKDRYKMVQCAPAVRVSLAEEFGLEFGALTPGKMAAALRLVGFDQVYDTNFSADLTIMEEAEELLDRVQNGGVLPMFTSCCPAWVRFVETKYPELIPHLSSCKSPMQMAGAMFKTYGAKKMGIDASRIYSVAVMPCTCKEQEAERKEMADSGYQDVDAVLTTAELAYLIKEAGIDFNTLAEEAFDLPLGFYSGAGTLFGVTGGVMEAALRTAYERLMKKKLTDDKMQGLREGGSKQSVELNLNGLQLKTWRVAGLKDVEPMLEQVKQGKADFQFMEVMTCPAGCISGGGQPKLYLGNRVQEAYDKRRAGLYQHDQALEVHTSHENPQIQLLYQEFLGEPLGHVSHKLLHTNYQAMPKKVVCNDNDEKR